VLFNKALITSA